MKRRLCIVAIFLLAGTLVNVAVAWGVALWSRTDGGRLVVVTGSTADQMWAKRFTLDRSFAEVYEMGRINLVSGWGYTGLWSRCALWTGIDLVHVLDVGWPLRCLSGEVQTDLYAVMPNKVLHALSPPAKVGPIRVDTDVPRCLPAQPILSGFAFNTLFYATLLWLLIPGSFVLRRFIRVKRGRCVKCGYPRGESAVCSECGKTLPRGVGA